MKTNLPQQPPSLPNSAVLPDYTGGSIVNLMSSITGALGGGDRHYPPLYALEPGLLATGNIVLLVVDGLGYEFLERAGPGGALHRHLHSRMTSVFPSTTASAITTFLTGLAPQQHAVTGWHMYFRELGSVVAVLPFRPRYGGPSLKAAGISPKDLIGHSPVFDRIGTPGWVVSPERIVHSEFNVAHSGRARRRGYESLGGMFGEIRAALAEPGPERRFVYAYFPELDSLSHEYGTASAETAACFAGLDAAFGRFLEDVAGSGSTILVTADHGFIDVQPEQCIDLADHPALAETLALPLCGERRLAYCYVRPDKRSRFERYSRGELGHALDLFTGKALVEKGYFGLGKPDPRLLQRIGDYVLVMKDGWTIKDRVAGEVHHTLVGVHGGVTAAEMYVPLVVATV